MMNRVLITRIAIVCLVCLTSSLLWGRGGAGNGGTRGGAAGGAGGFRGGAGGHSGPAAAANGAPHPGGAPASHSGNPQGAPGGSGSQPSVGIHGAQGPAPGATPLVVRCLTVETSIAKPYAAERCIVRQVVAANSIAKAPMAGSDVLKDRMEVPASIERR